MAGYGHLIQMVDSADVLLRDQQKRERAVAAAYQAGETDRLALLSAQYETATAEFARANTLIQMQQTLGQLEDALRTPLGVDVFAPVAEQAITPNQFR